MSQLCLLFFLDVEGKRIMIFLVPHWIHLWDLDARDLFFPPPTAFSPYGECSD